MLILTFSGIFYAILMIESSPLLVDDDPDNQCVLRSIKCKPSLQRPCCDPNDYCKQTKSQKSFRCIEKSLTGLGKFCESDEDCGEIRHSKCSKNECVCRQNNIEYNKTACAPILGGFCWKNELCATENSACIDQECQCNSNSRLIANKCMPNVLGAYCENDEVCQQVKFGKCSNENICVCSLNTISINQTHCASLVNGFCWSEDDCLINGSTCIDNKCKCEHGLVFESNRCVKAYIDMPCFEDNECSTFISHSRCSSSFTCICDRFYFEHDQKCLPETNTCYNTPFCEMENSACIVNVCQCKPGFKYQSDACVPIVLGDTCYDDYDCHHVYKAICSNDKKCTCNENFMRVRQNMCMPLVGGSCHTNNDCMIVHSTCIDFKCQCKPNFAKQFEDTCIFSLLGIDCGNDYECRAIENSKCSEDRKCECKENYVGHNGTECVPVLGAYCGDDETCAPSHSICLHNKCQCDDGFLFYNDRCVQPYVGMYCGEDDDCKQIVDAKCIDHVCTCKQNYDILNETACAPLLDQYCRPEQQCATLNSECINNKCQCDDDYFRQFHGRCVSKTGHFGISCNSNNYCIDIKYSECSIDSKCACKSNYVLLGDDKCIALIGEYCDSDAECISYSTVCIDHRCQCKEKFVMRSKYQCDRISLGRTCQKNHDCQVAIKGSQCSKDKICVCQKNHYALSIFECVPFLYERCSTNYDCRFNFSACIDNKCQCESLYRMVAVNQCVQTGSLYGCKEDLDCGDPWHNECSMDRKCICKANNAFINKSTCLPLLGGYCWVDHQCFVKNSKCIDFQCKCLEDYVQVSINRCMPAKQ